MATSFLQSNGWARFKQAQGWRLHRVAGFLGLQRDLPLGIKLLYLPELGLTPSGPRREVGVPTEASGLKVAGLRLKKLLKEIKKLGKNGGLSVARLEFLVEFSEEDAKAIDRANRAIKRLGLVKSPEEMQPEYRQLIDIRLSEKNLLTQMKSKGRYNIKIAERHGVQIQNAKIKSQNDNSQFKAFYDLYKESSERDGFTPRPLSYFKQMATHMTDHMAIYIASWKRTPIAAALVVFWQGRATYLYGGSSSANRNVMAPYLLHWKIIQDAKAAGFKTYDLLAIAPAGPPAGGSRHKFSGLRRFKEQFGGRSVRILGCYDLIFDPLRYSLFVATEKLRGRF